MLRNFSRISRPFCIRPGRTVAVAAASTFSRTMNVSHGMRNQPFTILTRSSKRFNSSSSIITEEDKEILNEERAVDYVDVCIVGAGPAGLATAIKLKQLDNESGSGELRVVVLEKASDFGSHIVSGAVLEPRALNELFPDDINEDGISLPSDLVTKVTEDHMSYLTESYAFPLPEPPQMKNAGKNFIVSLNNVVKYLSEQAEELGVELYPGISVDGVKYDESGESITGVFTKDMGVDKFGKPKGSFERGMEFQARMTVLGEGCHGSLTKQVIAKYNLREGRDPQTYGIGIKEVWEVLPENFEKGYVGHSMGFPLSSDVYGGGFMYHFGDGLVAVGIVVGLDYANPYVSPYQEFQKMKTHPYYKNYLEGGKCVSYAARALNEGGLQSIPQLYFPGGVIVGCSAGFMNVPKIKGTHTAIKSGIIAAESIFEEIKELEPYSEESVEEEGSSDAITLRSYEEAFNKSWAHDELNQVRNVRPSFNNGFLFGLAHSGLSTFVTKGAEPWTFSHPHTDAAATQPASKFKPIEYPKPDGKLTFDLLTSVSRTGTYHDEDEKCHLRIPNQDYREHTEISYPKYKGIEQKFCPAGVYEYVEDESEPLGVRFQINSQNCIHCKTCDIKVPTQDITWTVPEGGDGPKYYMT
ncbi:probable electron transfer flavoprotein-ubiquinone oxidoreductase, mitochondrial [[Candida] railenensis]|uniref:Electron transfer flavoprotein-ubiquinone oxidoreductase n=1 Tax=[Candida] railenensis TaxID=45579 RepID=A0A9P0QMB0_9ASCO|nr:probable electron transfer flavoprotein-ubiquinone oxidoreductase, mitochondrial [[Candida] railenensis]